MPPTPPPGGSLGTGRALGGQRRGKKNIRNDGFRLQTAAPGIDEAFLTNLSHFGGGPGSFGRLKTIKNVVLSWIFNVSPKRQKRPSGSPSGRLWGHFWPHFGRLRPLWGAQGRHLAPKRPLKVGKKCEKSVPARSREPKEGPRRPETSKKEPRGSKKVPDIAKNGVSTTSALCKKVMSQ